MTDSTKGVFRAFRFSGQRTLSGVFQAIGEARRVTPPARYREVLRVLRALQPKHRNIPLQKPSHYRDLLYVPGPPPLSLKYELEWAPTWLEPATADINRFLEVVTRVQGFFAAGNLEAILQESDAFVANNGWSFWAVELKYAALQELRGIEAVREYSQELQFGAKNRAAALFAVVFTDRNDPAYSFDSFSTKCAQSIPNFSQSWVRAYLPYRATSNVANPERDLPQILAREMSSSLFDYYETLIESLQLIRREMSFGALYQTAYRVSSDLIAAGVKDWRLSKIKWCLGSQLGIAEDIDVRDESAGDNPLSKLTKRISTFDSVYAGSGEEFLAKIHENIGRCEAKGIASDEAIPELVKLGVNFKSLPIAQAVAIKAINSSSTLADGPLLGAGIDLIQAGLSIPEILANPDPIAESVFRRCAVSGRGVTQEQCATVVTVLDSSGELQSQVIQQATSNLPTTLLLWLARRLTQIGDEAAARTLAKHIAGLGQPWKRHGAKIALVLGAATEGLDSVLKQAAETLIREPKYSNELPLSRIFNSRKWNSFRTLDHVLVAVVAHHAERSASNADSRFICRMACRAFFNDGRSQNLEEVWKGLVGETAQRQFVHFLRFVWIEDNLALLEFVRSTQEMRQERIRVLQFLLTQDSESSPSYSAEIQELTLDSTLWRGIKQINETRMFVNDAAITRWAEKELLPDFERWKQIADSPLANRLHGDIVKSYLVEADIAALIAALPKEQVTEANTLLLAMANRLLVRFLKDPTDGLDCYLSSRIRHGTMRGTLLGPLEAKSFLILSEQSEHNFREVWGPAIGAGTQSVEGATLAISKFSKKIQQLVRQIVDSQIRIRSKEFPSGMFPASFDPRRADAILGLYKPDISFGFFLQTSYLAFWLMLVAVGKDIARYFRDDIRNEIQGYFSDLITELRSLGQSVLPLVAELQSVATATQTQCDAVADWFTPNAEVEQQTYDLASAIEIAKRVTRNVYRQFDSDIRVSGEIANGIKLSTQGLANLTDCLYVVFANAWLYAGLQSAEQKIELTMSFDESKGLLHLRITNEMSADKRNRLQAGELEQLKEKYLKNLPVDLVPREGGSGFAKLARLVAGVDRSHCAQPLDFGIDESGHWYVSIYIRLWNRGGAFDVYV